MRGEGPRLVQPRSCGPFTQSLPLQYLTAPSAPSHLKANLTGEFAVPTLPPVSASLRAATLLHPS